MIRIILGGDCMDNKDILKEHDCCGSEGCECGHDHDHDNDYDYEDMTIDIEMEDGTKVECEVLGTFEVEDKEYMVLLPLDEDEVLLFRYEEDDENEEFELTPIEDEKEFEIASEAYYELFCEEDEEDTEE